MDVLSVKQITDLLGSDEIAEAVGVKPRSVRAARENAAFPARWYPIIRDLCSERGIDCPDTAFAFVFKEVA